MNNQQTFKIKVQYLVESGIGRTAWIVGDSGEGFGIGTIYTKEEHAGAFTLEDLQAIMKHDACGKAFTIIRLVEQED